jgi:hypothetical protein
LSPTTLSNLIIEINEGVSQEEVLREASTTASSDNDETKAQAAAATPQTQDSDGTAALYHLRDLCDPEDALDIVQPPQAIEVPKLVSGAFPVPSARKGVVLFKTLNRNWRSSLSRYPQTPAVAPDGALQLTAYTCHYLLIRLERQTTDLVIFVNVPHEEFDLTGDTEGLAKADASASRLLDGLVRTLDVKNWDLFG